ncbi:ankyrin repeat domain-containing protein [Runella sp. MFBS21]|uniref:ankyrin repeat domain-containing protein n=1 Tax=Runella sp. MFBS21 TaxID=3034018 RepID=UPI0023F93431|nr:ankyrin repeat domain-containing protein [Runella sp. MFBS21]MDF7822313.1 ankyrin repeat domain-containing protein [Runella sp. MFBS21]
MTTLSQVYRKTPFTVQDIYDIVLKWIDEGYEVDNGFPLYYLAELISEANEDKFIEVLNALLERGYEVKALDVQMIIISENQKVVDYIKSKGIDVNLLDDNEENVFFHILSGRVLEISNIGDLSRLFQFAIKNGVRYDIINENGENLIHAYIKGGQDDFYLEELMKLPLDINLRNKWGFTPLHKACLELAEDNALEKLIKHGADITMKTLENQHESGDFSIKIKLGERPYDLRIKYLNTLFNEFFEYTNSVPEELEQDEMQRYENQKNYYKRLLLPENERDF